MDLEDIDIELAKFLLDKVDGKKNSWTYTYKEVAAEMSKRLGRPINAHFGLSHPLGNVMELCFDLDLPLILIYPCFRHWSVTREEQRA